MPLERGTARQLHRLAEGMPLEHLVVEDRRERRRRRIVNGPSGGDHRTDTHPDELRGDIRRQAWKRTLLSGGRRAGPGRLHQSQITAVDEHEIGNAAHLLHFRWREEHAITDHHAGHGRNGLLPQQRVAQGLSAGVAVPRALWHVPVHAVARQVQQLVGAGEQRAHHLLGRWPDVLRGKEGALQRLPHGFRLRLRAFELDETADRVADHQGRVLRHRLDAAPELL